MSDDIVEADGYSSEMAEFAESIGEGGLYESAVKNEEYVEPEEAIDDDGSADMGAADGASDPEPNGEGGGGDEPVDDDGEDGEKKPWDVTPDRDEMLDSDAFLALLESSGKTEAELISHIQSSSMHTMKIRGKEVQVPYEKLRAEAQIAGASRQKSERMNAHIKDGMLIDTINKGGEAGKLALKAIISNAKEVYKSEDVEDLIDEVLDLEGMYDDSKDVGKAENAAEMDRFFGDVALDTPESKVIINEVTKVISDFFPKESGEGISNDYSAIRGLYNLQSSGALPALVSKMEDKLTALPTDVESMIRSNADVFEDMFEEVVKTHFNPTGNQPGEASGATKAAVGNRSGNSKTVSPPRSSSGKRIATKQANSDNDFLSMSDADLESYMQRNYTGQ